MPIAPEQVPILIKSSELKQIPGWKKDYFEKVAKALQVHTKGQLFSKVDTLFPNEHPDSKAHVISAYEPITKASIWKGIHNLLRIFSSSSFSINVGDELSKWLEDYETEGHNLLNYFVQEWVSKAVAEDPNGLFVIYPPDYAEENDFCPIQWVRSSMIKSRTKEYISFISEIDSEVSYLVENTTNHREVFFDHSVDNMNARTWTQTTYNERLKVKVIKEVVHLFTVDGFIIYTNNGKSEYEITTVNFGEPLSQLPFFAGGGPVADKADQMLYESFVHAFVPLGNLALLSHRNKMAIDLSYSYPRMSELQIPCSHPGCSGGKVRCLPSIDSTGFQNCPSCKGQGFVTVQSPYKIYQQRYDPNDANENAHLKTDPVKFFTPDVAIINYAKQDYRDYLKQAEEAIFVSQDKDTGNVESAKSKEIDLDDLYAWLSGVAKTLYNNMRIMLQCLEDYMSRNPMNVSVERPYSFAILSENEAFIALNEILISNAHVSIKANRVDSFVNKFVSKDNPIHRAFEVMKQYDPMLYFSDSQVSSYKGSNSINQEMVTKHILAYPMFIKLYMQDKNLIFESDEAIMKKLDKEIASFNISAPGEDFRQTIIKKLADGSGAAA